MPRKALLLGAAGRDFHNFNVYFRDNPAYEVVGFTATQIPDIAGRKYPPELAGKRYPNGILIYEEKELERLVRELGVDEAFFCYSDVSHEYVMHLASRVLATGASFSLLGPADTMLKSSKKVLSVCAVRTGAGKSPLMRRITDILRKRGVKFVVVRHPMPYGDLVKEAVQRFATLEDLDRAECTVEEREDYEPHIRNGTVVYAGVDYEKILRSAEKEADVVLWDGGNNDFAFFRPALSIVVADALRPYHELLYHPGETNFRMADIVVINKASLAPDGVGRIRAHLQAANPRAEVIEGDMELGAEGKMELSGKKALVIEDGPTVTHGGMAFGAGFQYAQAKGAKIIDPRPFAAGSIAETFKKYPHLTLVLPAVGYSAKQVKDLEDTINASGADVVVSGTPTDIRRVVKSKIPILHVNYSFVERKGSLEKAIDRFLKG